MDYTPNANNITKSTAGTFICNSVAGGLGSIHGAALGALLGGPIGVVGGILIGAAISTAVC